MLNKKNAIIFLFLLGCLSFAFSQNNPPSITANGNGVYCEGNTVAIATNVSITDPDPTDTTLDVIVIQISEGYSNGQDLLILNGVHPNINASWNANQGELTLTGNATFLEYENAIESVGFQTTQTIFTDDRAFSINIGNANYLPSTGHYYFYVADVGITWTQAEAAASSTTFYGLQGYLATITSVEESQLTGEQSPGTGWIGATDVQTEGTWRWVTGPEAGTVFWIGDFNGTAQNDEFSFWNNGEPNNFGGNENYAHITDPSIGNPGSWNDLPVTGDVFGSPYHPQGYLVEFVGMPGESTINLSTSTSLVMPRLTNVTDGEGCENNAIRLSAVTNADTILWYASSTSTTVINTGLTYNP
ncbi:MAG: C-type lectin domain-containing protein, partial [Olleya sp.]